MAPASVRTGTPGAGLSSRSRARSSSRDRVEQFGQRAGEVAGDGAGPGGRVQGGALALDAGDAIAYELGEEGVEVGEVPVQDTLGDARLRGDRPAGQDARPGPRHDTLGGLEQLPAHVTDVHPRRHRAALPSSTTPTD
jgi:hypothetical protein